MLNSLSRYADPVYCLMRVMIGLMFAAHGGQKIFGMWGGKVADAPMMVLGGWLEGICGLLIALGLFTRIAAFVASGVMAAAYFMMHAKGAFMPIVNKGELAAVYSFIFLFICFYGPGRYSLDAMIWKNRGANANLDPDRR